MVWWESIDGRNYIITGSEVSDCYARTQGSHLALYLRAGLKGNCAGSVLDSNFTIYSLLHIAHCNHSRDCSIGMAESHIIRIHTLHTRSIM